MRSVRTVLGDRVLGAGRVLRPDTRRSWLRPAEIHDHADAPGEPAETVRNLVHVARASFGSPKVLTYLPILIERAVRGQLSAARQPGPHINLDEAH